MASELFSIVGVPTRIAYAIKVIIHRRLSVTLYMDFAFCNSSLFLRFTTAFNTPV